MPNKASLKHALTTAYRTEAIVKNAQDADIAVATATSHWLELHKSKSWHIITVDLSLSSHLVSSMGTDYMSQRYLGILQLHTLHDFNQSRALVIYSSDQYTETWVHEWAAARAQGTDSRILNIVRNDPGPVIDLSAMAERA